MAGKGYTRAELTGLLKTQLEDIATQLGIDPAGLLKTQIADRIFAAAPLVEGPAMAALDSDVSDVEGSIGTALDRSPITTPPIHTPTNVTPRGSKLKGPTFDFSSDPTLFFELRKLEIAQKQQLAEQARSGNSIADIWNCWIDSRPSNVRSIRSKLARRQTASYSC